MENKETKKVGAMSASELADMIDKLMAGGNGSVSISALEGEEGFSVTTVNSRECGNKKGACCQPTELEIEED